HSEDVALISDAGTPLISDPGYRLVAQARLRGFHVIPIPGACAAIAALSVSGLPTDKFRFLGFLPAKVGQRKKALDELKTVTETLVFYEAPHRILASLNDLIDVFGQDRLAFMAREVSKTFETYLYGTISQIKTQVNNDSNQQRGEIVLIISGSTGISYTHSPETESLVALLLKELPITKAASLAAKITGGDKKQLYQIALSLQNK
ncbi:MAG: 16S rRNA (cytidine(1402)-2'-O)-methyltransferase, partial [Porticoccaceae bacterium]|nr:16S rRNA (cytidine(1402)-2'-O)-methyltransferase [Porticoccaceae bacterium]